MLKTMYKITEENLLSHELNGLRVKVVKSSDKNKQGLQGIIVRESKNTFTIETFNGSEKIVPKREAFFEFDLNGKKVIVNGSNICFRPEDRVKIFCKKGGKGLRS
jgi:ribonuclease P protein subunit POP4